ncbi:unnamed protein product [Phyllotreta striolata]|uniref:Uncharacterized protein n=1 Tax=Phyllotreta striolata TaxID=444603 RepID=A0A9N9TU91_PHYSR|nr:unnamed protein product [Phyllotreta striolata]
MGRVVILILFIGVVTANPTPKYEDTYWNDLLKIGSDVDIKTNIVETGRSASGGIEENIERYIKNHEVTFDFPVIGSKVTLEGKNLDNDEIDIKFKFGSDVQGRKKKSKLKKMFVPILVFIVIKAMTLIPLALGILGIKAWNATQLSFVSFVSALAMAIWKLCTKVTHEPPQIIHQTYDPHLHHFHDRQDGGAQQAQQAQQMAYSGYAPQ